VSCINPFTKKKSRRRVRISTEDLGVKAMAEYIDRMIAHASTEVVDKNGDTLTIRPPLTKDVRDSMRRYAKREWVDAETGEIHEGFPETTVACHSNFAEHGKAGARKADDCYSVWGCAACHKWLDQPIGHRGPTYEEKRGRFMLAHDDQVIEWRRVAADSTEPERFRKAALWALEQLNAGPLLDAIAAVGRAVL
jgi:hypothetical protein